MTCLIRLFDTQPETRDVAERLKCLFDTAALKIIGESCQNGVQHLIVQNEESGLSADVAVTSYLYVTEHDYVTGKIVKAAYAQGPQSYEEVVQNLPGTQTFFAPLEGNERETALVSAFMPGMPVEKQTHVNLRLQGPHLDNTERFAQDVIHNLKIRI